MRKAVGGVRNQQGVRLTGTGEKSDSLSEFLRRVYDRDRRTQGQTLNPATLFGEMAGKAITEGKVGDSLKKGCVKTNRDCKISSLNTELIFCLLALNICDHLCATFIWPCKAAVLETLTVDRYEERPFGSSVKLSVF